MIHKMHRLNQLKMVLTADVREGSAESAAVTAIAADSERFCGGSGGGISATKSTVEYKRDWQFAFYTGPSRKLFKAKLAADKRRQWQMAFFCHIAQPSRRKRNDSDQSKGERQGSTTLVVRACLTIREIC